MLGRTAEGKSCLVSNRNGRLCRKRAVQVGRIGAGTAVVVAVNM